MVSTYARAARADYIGEIPGRMAAWRQEAAPLTPDLRGSELLLDGLATFLCEGYEASIPPLRRAREAFDGSVLPINERLRWQQ